MNKSELKKQLEQLGILAAHYSLDGEILADRMIIYNSYDQWLVFYLDERGNRNEEKVFMSESDACSYLLERFKYMKGLDSL